MSGTACRRLIMGKFHNSRSACEITSQKTPEKHLPFRPYRGRFEIPPRLLTDSHPLRLSRPMGVSEKATAFPWP